MQNFFLFFTMVLMTYEGEFSHSLNFQKRNVSIESSPKPIQIHFEVLNIDSLQSVYLIYAKRNDSIVKILSKKDCSGDCRNIIVGQKYEFKIKSLLDSLPQKRHIAGLKFNNTLVKIEGGSIIWDLFACENLKGLCLQ